MANSVLWHVDDMKISHMKDTVLDEVITNLNKKYRKITPPIVTQGTVHEYLGMTLDYSLPGKVTIRMDDYVKESLAEAPAVMDGVKLIPVADHLFEVNDDAECLDSKRGKLFHHLMVKLLFLCKRA